MGGFDGFCSLPVWHVLSQHWDENWPNRWLRSFPGWIYEYVFRYKCCPKVLRKSSCIVSISLDWFIYENDATHISQPECYYSMCVPFTYTYSIPSSYSIVFVKCFIHKSTTTTTTTIVLLYWMDEYIFSIYYWYIIENWEGSFSIFYNASIIHSFMKCTFCQ